MPRAYIFEHYFGSTFVQACSFLSIKKCKAKFFVILEAASIEELRYSSRGHSILITLLCWVR